MLKPVILNAGFTLAELLISLAILGIIVTFTVPKILYVQQNQKYQAIGKETVGMVSGAYQQALATGSVSASTKMADLTQYMNYALLDTSSTIDYVPTQTSKSCSSIVCYRLHNGAILWFWATSPTFTSTANDYALSFFVDPDGQYSNDLQTPGKSAEYFLYYSGRISSRAYILTPTVCDGGSLSANSSLEPDWMLW